MKPALKRCLLPILSLFTLLVNNANADQIDDFIHQTMVNKGIPGLQLAIVKAGKIVKTGHYGYANLQDQVKVHKDTVFPINSMTKAFTGVALMQLIEQGKLTLDEPIGKHLPALPQQWHSLTTRQLLAHTTGHPKILSGHNIDLIAGNEPQAAWEKVQTLSMLFPTNTQFDYNQTGYIVLGQLIDKLSGQPFNQFITQQQLEPLKLTKTARAGFAYFEVVVPHQARQYAQARNGDYLTMQGTFAPMLRTAAGMSASAEELARYTIALQQGKLFDKPDSLKTLWTPAKLNNGKTAGFNKMQNGYAMGWQVIERAKHRAIAASGGDAVTMIVYPEDDLTIVVLTNRLGSNPINFVDEIAGFYFPEMKRINSPS